MIGRFSCRHCAALVNLLVRFDRTHRAVTENLDMASRTLTLLSTLALGSLVAMGSASAGADAAAPAQAAPSVAAPMKFPENPREAGARYGQAGGVAMVCYGMLTKPAVEELKAHYKGADLEAFNDQAKIILNAWKDLLACKHATGPNECKLSHGKSCYEANREIGMNGTKLPGLVDAKPEKSDPAAAAAPANAPTPAASTP
jgi:hypothetical protein